MKIFQFNNNEYYMTTTTTHRLNFPGITQGGWPLYKPTRPDYRRDYKEKTNRNIFVAKQILYKIFIAQCRIKIENTTGENMYVYSYFEYLKILISR